MASHPSSVIKLKNKEKKKERERNKEGHRFGSSFLIRSHRSRKQSSAMTGAENIQGGIALLSDGISLAVMLWPCDISFDSNTFDFFRE